MIFKLYSTFNSFYNISQFAINFMIQNQQHQNSQKSNVVQEQISRIQGHYFSQTSSPIKFKEYPESDDAYCPKIKINAQQPTLSLSYIYKSSNFSQVQIMGHLDEPSPSKNISLQIGKSHDDRDSLITQSKKKGIKQYQILIKRRDNKKQPSQNSVLITSITPLKQNRLMNYFEFKVAQFQSSLGEKQYPCFSFGITNKSDKIGPISISFKFNEVGSLSIYRNLNKIEEIDAWNIKLNDILGCGFIPHKNEIFLTQNGKYVLYKLNLVYPQQQQKQVKGKKSISQFIQQHNHKFYPFISVISKKITLKSTFENCYANFIFPYLSELKKYQQRLVNIQMPKKASVSQQSIYGLVLNYFKFYGLQKTGQLFEAEMLNRNMKFYPQNQPLRNKIQYDKKLEMLVQSKRAECLKEKKIKKNRQKARVVSRRSAQNEAEYLSQQLEMISSMQQRNSSEQNRQQDQRDSMQQFCKLGKSSSIISRRCKKIIDKEQVIDETLEITLKNQEDLNLYLNKKKMERKVEQLKRSQQEKLKTERLQIIKNIQQGKIQKAMKLYSKSFKFTRVIEIFFKAHIFLKFFQTEGLQKALEYAKKQHHNFTQFQNYLMPFFNSRSLHNLIQPQQQNRPLREILFLICSENKEKFNFQRQAQIFSRFINKTICEDSGFFSSSKLQIALQHYRTINDKASEFQISVGGFDLEAMSQI